MSSGFCAHSQTLMVDNYLRDATFTTTRGGPSITGSVVSMLVTPATGIVTSSAVTTGATASLAAFGGQKNGNSMRRSPSARFSTLMPGLSPTPSLLGSGIATSTVQAPATTMKYVVGTPTSTPGSLPSSSTAPQTHSSGGVQSKPLDMTVGTLLVLGFGSLINVL